ncbi:MAG: hypothetical protein ACI8QC_003003 [Planctomycetota bacterium]|jgi:hypothetical protein
MFRIQEDDAIDENSWVFIAAIRRAAWRVPLWLTCGVILGLFALALAAPTHDWFRGAVGSRYAVGEVAVGLDTVFRTDHGSAMRELSSGVSATALVLQALALLLGVFAAGGWLQVILERTHGQYLRRFLLGGWRYFWRFLRVALLAFVVAALFRWVLYGMPWQSVVLEGWMEIPKSDLRSMESVDSELIVRRLGWAQDGLMALMFALTLVWATYTRTRLALHDTRSVLWAGWCSFGSMLAHPIKTLRPMILLALMEALVVVGLCGAATAWLEGRLALEPERWLVLALGATGLVALIWREILRGARYYAAVRVSKTVVKPSLRPDPWNVIGGPGGPQYPMGDEDDERYEVAV